MAKLKEVQDILDYARDAHSVFLGEEAEVGVHEYELLYAPIGASGSKLKIVYILYWRDKPLFYGDDIRIPMFTEWTSDEAAKGILEFFALGRGDVDEENFTYYTKEQKSWLDAGENEVLYSLMEEYFFEEDRFW